LGRDIEVVRRCEFILNARVVFFYLACIVLLLLDGIAPGGHAQTSNHSEQQPRQSPVLPSEPTGADRCSFCHRAEVEGYARSAMYHSLRRPDNEPDGTVAANGSKITMHSSPSGFWQRWENAGDETEYHVDYVVGSGNHATGYLVDLGGYLFQSPVAYYTSRKAYDLAPGYENQPDPDFTRPISEECVLCHSGNALHVVGTLNQYRSPVFSAEGITCERCHGPSERHLADPRAGTIVNPAKLSPAARDSICEQCHLFGATRVANPGKQLSDFVPGVPLEETYTVYHDANPTGAFKVISQVEQLALSACARNSGGKLWCGTCHDPHNNPLQPVESYRSRCLSCHTAAFSAPHPPKDSNCIACHMPRRAAKDGGHSAFTDHGIQRQPRDLPEAPPRAEIVAWREPAAVLRERNLGIADIAVGMERHSFPLIQQGYRDLTDVQQQFSNDSEFFRWIGEALLAGGQNSEAEIALERSLQLDPNSAQAEARVAAPYMQDGNVDRAMAHLERAVALDPVDLPASTALIRLYRNQGRTADAAALSAKIGAQLAETTDASQNMSPAFAVNSSKTAGEAYKNIQVLKGIPSDQLIPTMRFISSSLGVGCTFCHVEGRFEEDDKKTKQTARGMMRMTLALNRDNFEGQRQVTCYSCHHGTQEPVATPLLANEAASAVDSESAASASDLPTVQQVIDNYVQAEGGAEAIEKIFSRAEKGTIEARGQSAALQVFTEEPGKRAVIEHRPIGDDATVYDGQAGWLKSGGMPMRAMNASELAAANVDADLHFPLHIRDLFPELHVQYSERVDGKTAYVLLGSKPGQSPVKFYFEAGSGLLIRMVRHTESPLGLNPTQIDYADYRPVDGVQVPFRITISEPGSVVQIDLEDVQQNVPIEDAKFAKPNPKH